MSSAAPRRARRNPPATPMRRCRPSVHDYDRREPRLRDLDEPDREPAPPPDDFPQPMLEPSISTDDTSRPIPPRVRHAPPPPLEHEEELEGERRAPAPLVPRTGHGPASRCSSSSRSAACCCGSGRTMVALYRAFRTPATEVAQVPAAGVAAAARITDRGSSPAAPAQGRRPPSAPAPRWRRRSCSTRRIRPIRTASASSARRSGAPRPSRPGPNQPPELAIRADVEVPERKLTMTWSLRRNTDKTLPASHTVEIIFKLPADFPLGRHLQRARHPDEGSPNRPAACRSPGWPSRSPTGFFLIGLSTADADRERNIAMLKERRLVRHPGGLQQQPPRHPGDRKRHAGRTRLRRRLQGVEAVKPLRRPPRA